MLLLSFLFLILFLRRICNPIPYCYVVCRFYLLLIDFLIFFAEYMILIKPSYHIFVVLLRKSFNNGVRNLPLIVGISSKIVLNELHLKPYKGFYIGL